MDFLPHFINNVTILSALAVLALHQILKLKFIPIGFANKYPVPTLILLSIGAAAVAVLTTPVTATSWTDWLLLVVTIAVVAAVVYNSTIRNWAELRASEGAPE